MLLSYKRYFQVQKETMLMSMAVTPKVMLIHRPKVMLIHGEPETR